MTEKERIAYEKFQERCDAEALCGHGRNVSLLTDEEVRECDKHLQMAHEHFTLSRKHKCGQLTPAEEKRYLELEAYYQSSVVEVPYDEEDEWADDGEDEDAQDTEQE